MRVLIACEFSGIVRRAFRARGHDAWSCDLLPAEDGEKKFHMQGDVLTALRGTPLAYRHNEQVGMFATSNSYRWDLMIAHPPYTYLANSGVRWLDTQPGRRDKMRTAAYFFLQLERAPIARIAIENPIPHKHAKQWIGKYSQLIQPWQFGHGETKATCLWLKNLPPLKPTSIVEGRAPRVHYVSPGPDRWKERSRTLQGIADAMAEQWSIQ